MAPQRPDIGEVRRYLAGEPFASWKKASEDFATSAQLDAKNRKSYLRALLYPARLLFSWATGRMDSNDVAVRYVAEQAPDGLDIELVQRALACRQAASDLRDLEAKNGAVKWPCPNIPALSRAKNDDGRTGCYSRVGSGDRVNDRQKEYLPNLSWIL